MKSFVLHFINGLKVTVLYHIMYVSLIAKGKERAGAGYIEV